MTFSRRRFPFALGAATFCFSNASALAQVSGRASEQVNSPNGGRYFFQDDNFETIFLTSLGRAYHSGGDVGRVLYLTPQVKDGDFESAYRTFKQAGDEAHAVAEESAAGGHRESARQAYLWAQNFYDSSTYFLDGSNDSSRFLPTWQALYDCWLKSLPFFDPPIEPVSIPYEGTTLHGFYMRGKSKAKRRPLLILSN